MASYSRWLPPPRIAPLCDTPKIGERPEVMAENERVLSGGACEEPASHCISLPGIHVNGRRPLRVFDEKRMHHQVADIVDRE